jgi:hypothetical protein
VTRQWGGFTVAVAVAIGLLVAGCTTDPTPSPDAPTSTPKASETPGVPVDLATEFRSIVDASCDRAYELGITESVEGSDTRLVLVPQAQAYNDFTAAAVNNDIGLTPIWSTEDFAVCIESINYSMSEDGGSVYGNVVTGDLASGKLRSEYVVEDYGVFVSDYVVVDGFIVEVTSTTPDSTTSTAVRYGMPSDGDLEHFRDAIDSFLASE